MSKTIGLAWLRHIVVPRRQYERLRGGKTSMDIRDGILELGIGAEDSSSLQSWPFRIKQRLEYRLKSSAHVKCSKIQTQQTAVHGEL